MGVIETICRAVRRAIGNPASDRMTIPLDQQKEMERKIKTNPILANAFRLMCDASLLIDNHSYSSAVALAVLSLEEIGKYLLGVWTAEDEKFKYDKRRFHQMKQAAIGALFIAEGARKEVRKRNINMRQAPTAEDAAALAAAVIDGSQKTAWFANSAKGKVIETVKWSGIYYDADLAAKGIEPSKIKRADAVGIMELCSRSFMLIGDDGNVAIAKYSFPMIYNTEVSDPITPQE
jgi:AbiV family abortive infection protein